LGHTRAGWRVRIELSRAEHLVEELVSYMHLAALNRGITLTPFHNMALISPDTTEADIDHHTQAFRECIEAIAG
jgi:glutamate-1-semialdehyde aminotransferase